MFHINLQFSQVPPVSLTSISLQSFQSLSLSVSQYHQSAMSFLSHLNPTPGFPSYTGPYQVGSVDVEIPVADLEAPSPAPDSTVATTAFRVFYPCEPGTHERPVRWIPNPQRGYVSAYARFLGAGSAFSELFS